jgi:hypothetical protein
MFLSAWLQFNAVFQLQMSISVLRYFQIRATGESIRTRTQLSTELDETRAIHSFEFSQRQGGNGRLRFMPRHRRW